MKKTINENYRVVVIPDNYGNDERREVEYIREQILRHVDVNKHSVNVEWDVRYVCEFCGRDPEETVEEGPCCCNRAVVEWEAQKA